MATVTSGSTSFNLQLTDLVEEAFERAGSELRTGYDLRTARRSLNLLFADWANRGVNMWTIDQGEITLVPGQNTYALPNDTVDLLEHVIRTGANVASTQADQRVNLRDFAQQIAASASNSGVGAAFGWPNIVFQHHFDGGNQLHGHHNPRWLHCWNALRRFCAN